MGLRLGEREALAFLIGSMMEEYQEPESFKILSEWI
jgi:hypothetical protein